MLLFVRAGLLCAIFALIPFAAAPHAQQNGRQPAPQTQAAPPRNTPAQPAPQVPSHQSPVIVLDPGHGGTDTGARGPNGTMEKDVVLQFARAARAEFERLGFHVVMTRSDDSDPSDDDRAAMANSYPNAIFIAIHVASTGAPGTARAYYGQFPSVALPAATAAPAANAPPRPGETSLVPWAAAQDSYTNASHRLADLLQSELDRQFAGSPSASAGAAVRDLRSVGAPAVAVEASSISVTDPNSLLAMAGPLAVALTRAVQAFAPIQSAPASGSNPGK